MKDVFQNWFDWFALCIKTREMMKLVRLTRGGQSLSSIKRHKPKTFQEIQVALGQTGAYNSSPSVMLTMEQITSFLSK